MEQLGRTGEWNPVTMQGNPMLSNQMKRMTKGYKEMLPPRDMNKRAAEPIYSGKIKAMLEFLMLKQQTLPGKDKLLLIRDGLLISMLWQSCFRGFNVGKLRLENIKTPTNSPAIPFIVPQLVLQPNYQLHIQTSLRTGKAAIALSPSVGT